MSYNFCELRSRPFKRNTATDMLGLARIIHKNHG